MLLLFGFGLVGALRLSADVRPFQADYRDREELARVEERFTLLHAALPQRGTVSFLPGRRDRPMWYRCQYVLAPLVLAEDGPYPLAIGLFDQPPEVVLNGAGQRLRLASDLDGVQLFRPEDDQ
jgi:hypothetical protein